LNRSTLLVLSALAFICGAVPAKAGITRQASEKIVPATGIRSLRVENRRGSTDVQSGTPGRIRIVAVKEILAGTAAERRRFDEETQVTSGVENGALVVRVTYPQSINVRLNFFDLFNGFELPRCDVRLRIEVPPALDVALRSSSGDLSTQGIAGSQSLESSSGDIEVQGASGNLVTYSSSGDVTAHDVMRSRMRSSSGDLKVENSRGPIDLHASSGDIEVRGAADSIAVIASSGDVEIDAAPRGAHVETQSGRIQVAGASGGVRLSSSSGDIQVGLAPPLAQVDIGTSSGEVVARVSGSPGLSLDLGTSGGSIEAEMPLRIHTANRHELTGTVGDGRTPVRVRTSSGDIHLSGGGR
jgi:lia operon protein LiaG